MHEENLNKRGYMIKIHDFEGFSIYEKNGYFFAENSAGEVIELPVPDGGSHDAAVDWLCDINRTPESILFTFGLSEFVEGGENGRI